MYDKSFIKPSKKFMGVYWHDGLRKWRAQIKRSYGKTHIVGHYDSEREAAEAFNAAVRERDGFNGGFLLSSINFFKEEA
jgi:hypothetical protein